jgi:hypothetical protein
MDSPSMNPNSLLRAEDFEYMGGYLLGARETAVTREPKTIHETTRTGTKEPLMTLTRFVLVRVLSWIVLSFCLALKVGRWCSFGFAAGVGFAAVAMPGRYKTITAHGVV